MELEKEERGLGGDIIVAAAGCGGGLKSDSMELATWVKNGWCCDIDVEAECRGGVKSEAMELATLVVASGFATD